jgi:TonB family protein
MPKNLLTLLFVCMYFVTTAQESHIYYDATWQETSKKKAKWHRIYTEENGLYKIEDHYADGPLYMSGYRSSIASNSCRYREGAIVFYDHEGHKMREGQYKAGERVGRWKHYYPGSDALSSQINYDDSDNYTVMSFDSASQRLVSKNIYSEASKHIHWDYTGDDSSFYEYSYLDTGDVTIETTRYADHSLIEKKDKKDSVSQCFNEKNELIPCPKADTSNNFVYVEKMPECTFDINKYLAKNIRYPKFARTANIEGRVIIRFTVDEDGAISEVKLKKGIGGGCDEEAMRVVSEMPYWEAGSQNGKLVRVYFTLPIVFKLK